MKLSPTINFSFPAAGFLYLCAYVLLDLLTDALLAEKIGVTPWHPSAGLSFCLVLLWGTRALPLLFIAPFLAELTLPGNLALAAMEAAAAGVGYSLVTILLLRPEVRFDTSLGSLREVFRRFCLIYGDASHSGRRAEHRICHRSATILGG